MNSNILHVCNRDIIRELRNEILRLQGYEVISATTVGSASDLFRVRAYTLVLIDVDVESRVEEAEKLCSDLKEIVPDQSIAFVCNHRLSIHSDCPDEIIRMEFNPGALVKGVQQLIQ